MYELLARYYDLENADLTDDLPFWLELAEETGGPVLEIGCGTGRVLFQLAQAGHRVAGIDNSPQMLGLARAKLTRRSDVAGRVELLEGEMKAFDLGRRDFRLAILPFNTFSHLLTTADQAAALTAIRRHLADGGQLAMDLPNPGDVYASEDIGVTLERTFRDEPTGSTVQQFSSTDLDRAAQVARVTWLYDTIAPDGAVRRAVVPMTFRYTFPAEMSLLLEKCGFSLSHLYGDYDRSPFADGAPRMLTVATARPGTG